MSKRQFLRLGAGGAAAWTLLPYLSPVSTLAAPVVLSPHYFESSTHRLWMKLSYNGGKESRQTRRRLGAALRNVGVRHGRGDGYQFAAIFDQAVDAAFERWRRGGRKSRGLLELVQSLYDDFIYPRYGAGAGRILFFTLLSLVRAREGSTLSDPVYRQYLSYRNALQDYKLAREENRGEAEIQQLREEKSRQLESWQTALEQLVEAYATRTARLSPDFFLNEEMIDGFELAVAPVRVASPELRVARAHEQLLVSWEGGAKLQRAPTINGPWTDARKTDPAGFSADEEALIFRTVTRRESR